MPETPKLSTATEPDEILEAVARWAWFEAHDGADCPGDAIPTLAMFSKWMLSAPVGLVRETAALEADCWNVVMGHAVRVSESHEDEWNTLLGREHVHLWASHILWQTIPIKAQPAHPLVPLVKGWQGWRMRQPDRARVTVTSTGHMTRRPMVTSHVRMLSWQVDAVAVDGEPMMTRLPDPAAAFPLKSGRGARVRRWVQYKPGEQGTLPLHGLGDLPVDARLVALSGLDGVLCGDMLALLTLSETLDHPIEIDERTGASLLARNTTGGFRSPKVSDVRRFWDAARDLYGTLLRDPSSGRWVNLAYVEPVPDSNRILIGPPAWRRFGNGARWVLTAEGGRAGRTRIVVGKKGAGGRLITGIEYALAARYTGGRGVAPDLSPANGKAGPGPTVTMPLPVVATLMGEVDPTHDRAALMRVNRAVDAAMPMYQTGIRRGDSAPAGDSVEIIERVRGSRARRAALKVRASARFVEAARLAKLTGGEGFATMTMASWLGLNE